MVYMKLKSSSVAATLLVHELKSPEQMESAVPLQNRGHAHGGFAAVTQAVERDALAIHERQRVEPAQDLIVLAEDEREQRGFDAVGLAARASGSGPRRDRDCAARK